MAAIDYKHMKVETLKNATVENIKKVVEINIKVKNTFFSF